MSRAFLDGVGRVAAAPMLIVGLYAVLLAAAVPFGIAVRDAIADHLDASARAPAVARGVNWPWWEEFQAQADGLAATFEPRVLGFAAVLHNLSGLADARWPQRTVLLAVTGLAILWCFLAGGVLDRLARRRRVGSAGFFAACGTYFFRFVRLALLAGGVYWLLFTVVHDWLFEDLYGWLTRDLTVERTAFAVRLGLYGLFGMLLATVTLVCDYAKIRAVVEDRRSMIGALLAALRFIRRRPFRTIGLFGLNGACLLAVLLIYALAAPRPVGSGLSLGIVFVAGQVYVLARLFALLVRFASETAFFQQQLAHAEYIAAPAYQRPESPAAEAISTRRP